MQRSTFIWSLTGVFAIIGFLLTVQLTSRQSSTSTSPTSYLDYRTQVDEQIQEHALLTQDIAKAQAQLAQYQSSQGNKKAMQAALKKDAQTVEAEAGLTPVTGNGITVTIEDDPSLPFYAQTAGKFSQNADVIISQIVNDLYGVGATAISINGQRLVTTSSIRLVSGLGPGSQLQINTYPVQKPYVITAVGNISLMRSVLTVDQVKPELALMQESCLISDYKSPQTVTVPGYSGPLPGTWAKEVNN